MVYSSDKQIDEAVIVEVSGGDSHFVTRALHGSLVRDIQKSAVPLIAIELIPIGRIYLLK